MDNMHLCEKASTQSSYRPAGDAGVVFECRVKPHSSLTSYSLYCPSSQRLHSLRVNTHINVAPQLCEKHYLTQTCGAPGENVNPHCESLLIALMAMALYQYSASIAPVCALQRYQVMIHT